MSAIIGINGENVEFDAMYMGTAGVNEGWSLGGAVDIFNFPLTILNRVPVPADAIRSGHIWVIGNESDYNQIKLNDAVTIDPDGTLYLKVDDTNNGSDSITQSKKVGSTKMTFTSNRDTGNDTNLPWQVGLINKSGNVIDIKRKVPLVYSRLAGVLDMRTAYMWDGTQWIMISQNGSYVYIGTQSSSGTHKTDIFYNRAGNTLTLHSDVFSQIQHITDMARSADGTHVFAAVNLSAGLIGRFRQGDSFVPITFVNADGVTVMSIPAVSVAVTADSSCVAAGTNAGSTYFFKKITDTKYQCTTYYASTGRVNDLDFNYDGTRAAIASSYSSGYKTVTIVFVVNQRPDSTVFTATSSTSTTATAIGIKFIPNSNDFIAAYSSLNFTRYNVSGATYVQGLIYTLNIGDYSNAFDITKDGLYLVFTYAGNSTYLVNITTMTVVKALYNNASEYSYHLKLSDDNKFLAICRNTYTDLFSLSSDFVTAGTPVTLLQTIPTYTMPAVVGFIN